MENNSYREIDCPSCGTTLLVDSAEKTTHCPFCGLVIQWPKTKPPAVPPVRYEITPAVPAESGTFRIRTRGAPRVFLLITVMCALGTMVGIGLLVWLAVGRGTPDSFLRPALLLSGPSVLLESGTNTPPDAIVFGYDVAADKHQLARVSPDARGTLWRGKNFEDISDIDAIVASGDRFFTVEGAALHAYSAADGHALWQAGLSDKLGYCPECLSVSGNLVIAMTRDYTLQAFDAAGGEPAWSRRMADYTKDFWILGDSVLVIDQEPGQEYRLMQLSITSGDTTRQITPECRRGEDSYAEYLSSAAAVLPDPNVAGTVYLIYGYSPACIERWDLADGARKWQTVDEKGWSPSNDYAFLLTGDTLYFAAEHSLWAADIAGGQTRLVTQPPDYEPVPLAAMGKRLIVRARRTRGTTRFELWGMESASGERDWQRVFATGVPLDPPDAAAGLVKKDQSAWTYRMGDGWMNVLEFQARPYRLLITTLDTQSGGATSEKSIALKMDDDYFVPKILGWRDSVLWAIVDNGLYGIDTAAGKIAYSYP